MIDQCYTPDKGANQTRRDSLKSALRHHWEEVLIQAGINPAHLSGRHNACPICGGSDRFRFDDQEGDGTFYCNQCGAGDGFKLLMLLKGIGFGAVLDLLDGNRTELEQLTSVSVKNQHRSQRLNANAAGTICSKPGVKQRPLVKETRSGYI